MYQQQQQQPVQASTSGMVWNGSAWIHVTPGNASACNQNPQQIPDNPVQTFTRYYHEWTAREGEIQKELLSIGGMTFADHQQKRQQLENERLWAKYYADESSRAAHHFYQNPDATSSPFPLPQAPPSCHPTPPIIDSSSSNNNNSTCTPGSLTRFLKRNLALCKSDSEKKHVQAHMEKLIAKAIQDGNLQSKNWDHEPLIPKNHRTDTPQGGYYGPASDAAPATASVPTEPEDYGNAPPPISRPPNHGSYYGPSSFSHKDDAYSYYGNPNRSSLSPSNHPQNRKAKMKKRGQGDGSEDYLALPTVLGNNKHKKQRSRQMSSQNSENGMDASSEALAKRASRFAATGYVEERIHNSYTTHDRYMGKGTIGGVAKELDETDFEQMTVKGTCPVLEKEYLRLTAPPRPERVRPLPVLRQHLHNLKREYYCLLPDAGNENEKLLKERERTPQDRWKCDDENNRLGNSRRHDYLWFCSQLKALRQDCTVQRIQGDFAVDVYETHARIALQEGDLNEYNQCQTQLKELYKTLRSTVTDESPLNVGKDNDTTINAGCISSSSRWENEDEFIAYRLLYYVYLSTNEKYSGGSSDMFHIMLSLTGTQKTHPAIAHALQIRESVACSDYCRFFRTLHTRGPNLGIFLTDLLVPSMRMRGLRRMVKAYRPSVELDVCLQHLGLDVGTAAEVETGPTAMTDGTEFLVSCGVLVKDGLVLTKDSEVHEPVTDKKNSLI